VGEEATEGEATRLGGLGSLATGRQRYRSPPSGASPPGIAAFTLSAKSRPSR
jgi:hypothetical protein